MQIVLEIEHKTVPKIKVKIEKNVPAFAPVSRDSSDSSTLPRTFRANSLHLSDLNERDPRCRAEVGLVGLASPSLRLPPPFSACSAFSAFSAALLMGEECRLDDTEDTLRRSPAAV